VSSVLADFIATTTAGQGITKAAAAIGLNTMPS